MASNRTYLFPLPEVSAPVGGVNVLLQIIDVLRGAGYDAAPLYASQGYAYDFWPTQGSAYYDPVLSSLTNPFERRLTRLKNKISGLTARFGQGANVLRKPAADDVLIAPEYCLTEVARVYPQNPIVLAVQNGFGLLLARHWDEDGDAHGRVAAAFSISDACEKALRHVFDGPAERITLPVGHDGLAVDTPKKRQIAFMPRKRAEEAGFVTAALRAMPELDGWEIVEIDGMTPEQVADILRDTLIFLSFSEQEGFGLPPAEAMLAGCVVVGYAGIGGEEFFSDETAIQIADSDFPAMIEAARATVVEYDRDPSRLDTLRRKASDFIGRTYTKENFEDSVLRTWKAIEARLPGPQTAKALA